MRRFLPELLDLIGNRTIDPGKVFDLTLPLDQAAEGYGRPSIGIGRERTLDRSCCQLRCSNPAASSACTACFPET